MTAPIPEQSSDLNTLPGIRHGFFNRQGGYSSGIYEGLNCGTGSKDDPALVFKNRALVAEWFGAKPEQLYGVSQTHSAAVRLIDQSSNAAERPEADALVTDRPDVILSVLTADCTPVLLADPDARVIGAAHAGWRGAAGGVLQAVVDQMTELGAQPERIHAAIGPTISGENYEVGEDFVDAVLSADASAKPFFLTRDNWPKPHFDLPGYARDRLTRLGLAAIEQLPDSCTYDHPDRYFSWRYNQHQGLTDYGRMIATISMTKL